MVGRLGRFFYFGAREYGVHPTSKILRFVNNMALYTFANMLDKYALSRTISGRGVYTLRHFGIVRGYLIVVAGAVFLVPFITPDLIRNT